jgi:hypothetical protein
MTTKPILRLLSASAILCLVTAVAGCATAQPTETVTVTTSASPAEQAAPVSATPRAHKRKHHMAAATYVACDANITAKAGTTSCPFAQNVFYEFWRAVQNGDDAIRAYSPVTQRSYEMDCSAGATVVCRGGDGSDVRFGMSAVEAYDSAQAERYLCSAELGPDIDTSACDGGVPAPSSSGTDSGGSRCDPNYAGACLDPDSYDYDCEGGSGDGPDYTGPVEVVGDDPYGLDRDGDGHACDS